MVEFVSGTGSVELSLGNGKVVLSLGNEIGKVELSPGITTGDVEFVLSEPSFEPGVLAQGG